jgi:ABC-type transporter Mla subunit MlaD
MVNLLKSYGGECNMNLQDMFDVQHEKEKLKSSDKTHMAANLTQQAKTATGAISQAMSAMKERGERLEKLDNTTASLQNEATNYADMAKQLKEKTKKKSLFGLGK